MKTQTDACKKEPDRQMNRALAYLWFSLLKRRALRALLGLRRPTSLIGFAAVAFFVGLLYHYRHEQIFAQCMRPASLFGAAFIMIGGAFFKGFLQRGLVFEPPDVQFLFTSPFTQRQVIFYRLLPSYGYALIQSLVFLAIFSPHLKHPLITTICLAFFQIACFHIAAGAAIFAGTISEQLHFRLRCMLLGIYLLVSALYLRVAWDIKLVPSLAGSPLAQLMFYPSIMLADVGHGDPISQWTSQLFRSPVPAVGYWRSALYVASFAVAAWVTLCLLFKLKADIFENAVATSARVAEKRLRIQQGRSVAALPAGELTSVPLPATHAFRGAGAVIWKNLVVASRCRRELALAISFTLIYTGFLVALRWALHRMMSQGGDLPARQLREFDLGLFGLLAFLAFFLQRAFPFDFRRDGQHLVGFRTLPISPLALSLAELAVPTAFCLLLQALGIAVLMLFARFDWLVMLGLLLAFPAVVLALNGVWNLHYLLAATKQAGGKAGSASPVTMVMVAILSFLIFYPAGWLALKVGRNTYGPSSELLAFAVWLAVQYLIDFLLVIALAKLFQRFEVSRDSS